MDIFIRFIGLMLLMQTQHGGPYRAIIPKWESTDNFCNVQIIRHAAYIRVQTDNNQVVDDSRWPDQTACDPGFKCKLYEIKHESTLSVNGGFTPVPPSTPADLPCFVPHLKKEHLVQDTTLHPDALTTLSIADYTVPPGELLAQQFNNDMIFVVAKLKAPPGTQPQNITVTATPRVGGTPYELVLAPGTVIDIIDLPPQFAGGDYERVITDQHMEGHFFFIHKLLARENPRTDCKLVPLRSPSGCQPRARSHQPPSQTTLNLNCGPPGGP